MQSYSFNINFLVPISYSLFKLMWTSIIRNFLLVNSLLITISQEITIKLNFSLILVESDLAKLKDKILLLEYKVIICFNKTNVFEFQKQTSAQQSFYTVFMVNIIYYFNYKVIIITYNFREIWNTHCKTILYNGPKASTKLLIMELQVIKNLYKVGITNYKEVT